jgi:hypothetical protein
LEHAKVETLELVELFLFKVVSVIIEVCDFFGRGRAL